MDVHYLTTPGYNMFSVSPEFDKAPELSISCNLSNRKASPQEDATLAKHIQRTLQVKDLICMKEEEEEKEMGKRRKGKWGRRGRRKREEGGRGEGRRREEGGRGEEQEEGEEKEEEEKKGEEKKEEEEEKKGRPDTISWSSMERVTQHLL